MSTQLTEKQQTRAHTKVRTGFRLEDIKQDLAENLLYVVGKPIATTTPYDCQFR